MPQHDYVIDNQAGAGFRADVNNALAAIVASNSGATEPATMYANMWWADTTANILKRRNAGNTAWVSVMSFATVISAFADTLLDDTTASAMLTTLGVSAFVKTMLNNADAAAARTTLGVGLTPCVRGLRGNVNAATPLTMFDLSVDSMVLRDSTSGARSVLDGGPHSRTINLGLAGPATGGRDQAAAFAANSWVNLFYIYDGTTLSAIASTASHIVGPTLPAGYTHWAYATTIRWNASSNIIPDLARGSRMTYDSGNSSQRALSAGAATIFTNVSLASYVPTNALSAQLLFQLTFVHSGANVTFDALARVAGSSQSGTEVVTTITQVASNSNAVYNTQEFPLNASQQIEYKLNAAPSTSGGLYIDVLGYTVPNGDA